ARAAGSLQALESLTAIGLHQMWRPPNRAMIPMVSPARGMKNQYSIGVSQRAAAAQNHARSGRVRSGNERTAASATPIVIRPDEDMSWNAIGPRKTASSSTFASSAQSAGE